jgi:hypothetical protein
VFGEARPGERQLATTEMREQFADVEYGKPTALATFSVNAAAVMRQLVERAKRLDHRVRG